MTNFLGLKKAFNKKNYLFFRYRRILGIHDYHYSVIIWEVPGTVVLFRFQTEAPARFELVVGLIVLCWRISLGGFKKGTSSFAKQLRTLMSTTKLYKYKICTYINTLHIIQLLNEFLKFGSVLFLFMSIVIVQNNKTKIPWHLNIFNFVENSFEKVMHIFICSFVFCLLGVGSNKMPS